MSNKRYLARVSVNAPGELTAEMELEFDFRKEAVIFLEEQHQRKRDDVTLRTKIIPVVYCCPGEDGRVECDSFTQTCPVCGSDYNFSGTLLAPRSQWGEETGEDWGDCY